MTHLSSLVTEFCEDRTAEGLSHHTVASYRQTLSHFVSFVGGDTDPSEVTRKTVKSFLADRRQRGEATATLGGRHASLSAFWSWLVAEE
ncbi:MAG: site-specific integrase, partial [Nocardiopsis sp. BM-2018]